MALSFAAGTDTVNMGSNAVLDDLTDLTYIAWMYPTSALTSGGIIAKGTSGSTSRRSFEIRTSVVANGLFYVADYTTVCNAEANVLVANQWQCVAATMDGTSKVAKLYWGDLTTSMAECTYTTQTTGTGSISSNAALNQFVGSYGSGTTGGTGKHLADVAIFNRVLTVGELRDWQFNPRKMTGCVGFWRLGSNGTTNVPDLSGNFNTGSITGTTVSAHVPMRSFRMGLSSIRSPGGYTAPAYTPTDYRIPRGVTRGVISGAIA